MAWKLLFESKVGSLILYALYREQILSDTMTSSSGSNFTAIQISRESIVQHTTQSGPEEFSLYMRTLPVMSYPDHYAVRCINNIKEANRHLLELKRCVLPCAEIMVMLILSLGLVILSLVWTLNGGRSSERERKKTKQHLSRFATRTQSYYYKYPACFVCQQAPAAVFEMVIH